jgi:ubiquinone/menaquinone biosynthesis C-methylase UbiE
MSLMSSSSVPFSLTGSEDIDNHIAEIARVMKLGGVCLATYFVLDAVSRENIAAGLNFSETCVRVQITDLSC